VTLFEMYQEERGRHGVRRSIQNVAERTASDPVWVARQLGFSPEMGERDIRVYQGRGVDEGRCNACNERVEEITVISLRGWSGRLCPGCCSDLRDQLPK